MVDEPRIGKVVHFFDKIGVAVVALEADLNVGDRVHVLGNQTDFVQSIASMQVEHQAVSSGKAGSEVALKLDQPARRGDALLVPTPEG